MTVQVEFWQLITLLLAFLGFLFAAGKLLLSQIDRRLNERFETIEKAREEGQATWRATFSPRSSAISARARSIPALIPADVQISPSRM